MKFSRFFLPTMFSFLIVLPNFVQSETRKICEARRTVQPPVIDGRLDESMWSQYEPITGLIQLSPEPGQPCSQESHIWVFFDEQNLYVGAILFDEPENVTDQLFRRDDYQSSDWFSLSFDSYNDRRTAFSFGMNPAGVKYDIFRHNDDQQDWSWNAVWEGKTEINRDGWTAEFCIPFSQLRYDPTVSEHEWGMQFRRELAHTNEKSYWAPVESGSSRMVSYYGIVTGIETDVKPGKLELMPYVSGQVYAEPGSKQDPYYKSPRLDGNIGLDLKYGLTSNITLTGAINPDFGQVELDPTVINLSNSQTYFEEKRSFFIEGVDLFRVGRTTTFMTNAPIVFYSRRIGAAPSNYVPWVTGTYSDYPDKSTIACAAKVTGKTASGWSLGLLEVVTLDEHAKYQDQSGNEHEAIVQPATNYAMAVLRKDLIPGRTWAGGFIDAVNRKLDEDYLDQYYRKNAYVGGLDFYHRWSNMQWETSGVINFSHLDGSSEVITHVQQESQRYFQHPDADYIELDTTLTELNGYQGELTIAKESGENFIISATYTETSPGYTVNDLGFMNRADYRSPQAYMEYHDFVPSQYLRWWRTWFGNDNAWSLGGDQIWSHNFIGTKVGLHNFWEVEIEGSGGVKCWDDRATWGGPTIINPSSTGMKVNVDSDPRKKTQVGLDVNFSTDQYGGYSNNYDLSLRMRPLPSLQIILTGGTDVSQNKAHHITHVDDPLAVETYGSRYIFSDLIVHRETISVQADWVFNPEVTLQFFAEPGISSYDFSKYKELVKPRTFDFAEYGKDIGTIVDQGGGLLEIDPDGNGLAPSFHMQDRNFNFRTLKINCVLRWEYRLGSVFYLVWQQQRDSFQPGEGTLDNRDDIDALFNTEPINIVHAKLSYWLSI